MPAAANVTELMRGARRRLLLRMRRHRTCLDWAAYRPSPRRPFMLSPPCHRPAARKSRPGRRGSLTVEMILVVVVLAIVTVAIVQFGVFFANAQEVALAARNGGLEASQTAGLSTTNGNPVPADIIRAIAHQLDSSRIAWTQIRVEHNVTG